jgi:3-deoxy-D-manno-octulosonate 8-phosphate phosphatase (KDO 8-P phosphatase)
MSSIKKIKQPEKKNLKTLKMIAMDVDGVLTDGKIFLDQNGEEIKSFNALDGLGIVLARKAGLKIAFISARESKALELRAKQLGVDALYQNRLEKLEAFEDLLKTFHLNASEVAYIGDDLVDITILKRAGFPVTVPNAASEVTSYAAYVTKRPGGAGAVREVIELVMKSQGLWQKQIQPYL